MYQKETLPNGVRIITEEINSVRSVAIGIWVHVGTRDENASNNGISHFIEHLMFKGTSKRTPKDIAESLEAVGGQLNAFTGKEYTCYYAKVLDDHLDLAVDVLTDMFFNSTFGEKEIEREKNVVLEEIKMYEDAPDELVHDLFTSTMWQGHTLGRPILGTSDIIKSLTREDILNFYKQLYVPQNVVVAVAGHIKHQSIIDKLTPLFSNFKSTDQQIRIIEPAYNHAKIASKNKETEQVHLCIGAPGLALKDSKLYVMHALNSVLGGGISSRLFQKIREDRGLAYSVYSYTSSYQGAGFYSVYAGLSPKNLGSVMELITNELKDMAVNGLTVEELQRAKEQLKGSFFLGLEGVSSRMSRLGKSELTIGKVLTPDEVVEKINQINLEDIAQLTKDLFQPDKYTITTIGPIPETVILEQYKK